MEEKSVPRNQATMWHSLASIVQNILNQMVVTVYLTIIRDPAPSTSGTAKPRVQSTMMAGSLITLVTIQSKIITGQ